MFARSLSVGVALVLGAGYSALAHAQGAAAPGAAGAPDPTRAALVQMLKEAQGREATALVQAYTLQAQLDAANHRADDAEAKVKAADGHAPETTPKAEPGK